LTTYAASTVPNPDGGFPPVRFSRGRVNRNPRWIAATSDELQVDVEPPQRGQLAGQLPSDGFAVTDGFALAVTQHAPHGPPDHRDSAPVVDRNGKAVWLLASWNTLHGAKP
jgi:hypothetical protein